MSNIDHISISDIKFLQEQILAWFKENGRYFLWRKKSATNYELIISEVLLQYTKAETVVKFFPKFINMYQSWKQLSTASDEELQKNLKPIGLFRQRGSRLFKLAQEIKRRNGRFPNSRAEVEDIDMMGQYITNAYELFILKRHSPLFDINAPLHQVCRISTRQFDQASKLV